MCSGLMQNLEQTQKVLALFQQRVLGTPQDQPESERYLRRTIRGCTFFSFLCRVIPSATELDIAAILTHSLRQDPSLSAPASQGAQLENTYQGTVSTLNAAMDDDDGEGCCGGLIDCEGLVD